MDNQKKQNILDKSLVQAVLAYDSAKVHFLLNKGANPNAKYLANEEFQWYEPVAYLIAERGDKNMLMEFIVHGVQVDHFLLDAAERSKSINRHQTVQMIKGEMRRIANLMLVYSKGNYPIEQI